MNFYKRHLGDYLKKTSHLTLLEHGVYTRLIDVYYTHEKPIPDDKAARLIGARSKDEQQAVRDVLAEFFILRDGNWHQSRCDEEIANASKAEADDGDELKESRESRQERYRARRAAIFETLHAHSVHLPWNAKMDDLQDALLRVTASQKVSPVTQTATEPVTPVTPPVTPETRNVTATISHKPDSISQTPDLEAAQGITTVVAPENDARAASTRIGEICILLRRYGINTSPNNLSSHAWPTNPAVTDELLTTAIAKAKKQKPNGDIHPNYLKPIIEDLLNPIELKPRKADDWAWKRSDAGIDRKGKELGMRPKGTEGYRDYADRIEAEILKRKGKAA
jgi:uncharacterized protein YdaU (DUF1376 family)